VRGHVGLGGLVNPGFDVRRTNGVNLSGDEGLDGSISIGRDITFVTVVVLRSMGRSISTIGVSRPWLNIYGFLDNITDGRSNRVGTLSISACNIGSLVNEVTVRELSSDVDESSSRFGRGLSGLGLLLGGFLFLFFLLLLFSVGSRSVRSGLLGSLSGLTSSLWEQETLRGSVLVTIISSVILRIMNGSRGSSRPWLNIDSLLDDITDGRSNRVSALAGSAVDVTLIGGPLSNAHNWFLTPDTGSLVKEDSSESRLLLLSVESGVLSVNDGVNRENLLSRWAKILFLGFFILGLLFIGGLFTSILLGTFARGCLHSNGRDRCK